MKEIGWLILNYTVLTRLEATAHQVRVHLHFTSVIIFVYFSSPVSVFYPSTIQTMLQILLEETAARHTPYFLESFKDYCTHAPRIFFSAFQFSHQSLLAFSTSSLD